MTYFSLLFINFVRKSCNILPIHCVKIHLPSIYASLVIIHTFMHHMYSNNKNISNNLVRRNPNVMLNITLKNAFQNKQEKSKFLFRTSYCQVFYLDIKYAIALLLKLRCSTSKNYKCHVTK